mmetsp:Transcript_50477/g.117845  ORF Transcript_50477/g.117845 Transcript_50477/m.117845 type:complete len:219 (+) Transcript_50477:906-1562(+)
MNLMQLLLKHLLSCGDTCCCLLQSAMALVVLLDQETPYFVNVLLHPVHLRIQIFPSSPLLVNVRVKPHELRQAVSEAQQVARSSTVSQEIVQGLVQPHHLLHVLLHHCRRLELCSSAILWTDSARPQDACIPAFHNCCHGFHALHSLSVKGCSPHLSSIHHGGDKCCWRSCALVRSRCLTSQPTCQLASVLAKLVSCLCHPQRRRKAFAHSCRSAAWA